MGHVFEARSGVLSLFPINEVDGLANRLFTLCSRVRIVLAGLPDHLSLPRRLRPGCLWGSQTDKLISVSEFRTSDAS
ncbi:MAG: hypothetical protein OXI87_11530 [Albidovulum sp.]|nr:hypothetical protein [Albidovulum sp.]